MKNIIIIITALPGFLFAQSEIDFSIIVAPQGDLFASTVNKDAVWSHFLQPLYYNIDNPAFVPFESGSTALEFTANQKGIHHLLLTDNSDTLAYVVLRIDHTALATTSSWEILVNETDDPQATFAPSRANKVNSIFGLKPGLQD